MEHNVVAEVEIEDTRISFYTSIILRQKFNEHHSFAIRINHDVIEAQRSFSLGKAQKLIGKAAIIRLKKAAITEEVSYEFRGIICEISMEQSGSFSGDLILKGYSPTILLENGPHLTSFYKKNLKQVVEQVAKALSASNVNVNYNNQHKKEITYICQYRESNFHFLNRLSSDFNEWCYYDGTDLYFGKPASPKNIDVTYGEDINSIQFTLRILPLSFSNYSYNSKDDKVLNADAPDQVDGLDQYASFVLKESNKVFSEPVSQPLRQRVESKSDLEDFVKKQKAARAAELEVLTGTSDNPSITIGVTANIKVSKWEGSDIIKEDYGKFIITSIEHHVAENGTYYNTFEAVPAGVEAIPVKNVEVPIAEPQIATVKDNKDPDNMGRVRAQMLWQKDGEMTDWLRVMTPDAGGGKDGAKNRGLVVVPELGDQVLICFRYNDPDRPFVMGSMFHGKTGGGGGQGNNTKSLNSKSGHTLALDDGKGITIVDKSTKNKVELDGTDKITITADAEIKLITGSSSITMKKDGTIDIIGKNINVKGSVTVFIEGKSDSVKISSDNLIKLESQNIAEISGKTNMALKSDTKTEMQAPSTNIKGDTNLKLEGATVQVEGKTVTNVNGGILNLNCS